MLKSPGLGVFWNGVGNNILGANENVGPSIGLLIFSITDVLIIDGTVRNTLTVLSLSTRNLEVSALNTAAAATLAIVGGNLNSPTLVAGVLLFST